MDVDGFRCYANADIKIFCGDFFKTTRQLIGKIDAIYDRAAMVALPKDYRSQYAQHLMQLSEQEIKLLLISVYTTASGMGGPPYSVADAEIKRLYIGADIKLLHAENQQDIPPHLIAKGWRDMITAIYFIKHNVQGA